MFPNTYEIGPISRFMTEDHARLDRLLEAACRADAIDEAGYTAFRGGLLRHIGMEEKILFPYARDKRGGLALPIAAALRVDHSEIAKLLVRSPSDDVVRELRLLLARHNALEEGPGGLYDVCDTLAGTDGDALAARLRAAPDVPLAPYYDGPHHRRA